MAAIDLQALVHEIAVRARRASEQTAELSSAQKDAWLRRAAERLESCAREDRAANAQDIADARANGLEAPLAGRLELSDAKWRDMIAGLRDVAALPDPVGRVEQTSVRPNGLEVGRDAHPARRDRHDLRVAPERDGRRRGAVREGRATR
jgi:glutamate-5-semialdehyde dehydrogenase